jgi:hypothetical protein
MGVRGSRGVIVCLVGVLACVAVGCKGKPTAAQTDVSKWKSYDRPGFSARFPSSPTIETQHITQSGLNVDLTIYKADLGTSHYTVSYVTYPSTVDVSTPQNNLNGAVNGALQSSGIKNAHVVKQTTNTVSGSPGMEVEASADNGYLFLEAILRDHTLFQVLTANDQNAPPASAQPFIDSVTLK